MTFASIFFFFGFQYEPQLHVAEMHSFADPAPPDDHQLISPNQAAKTKNALKNDYVRLATAIDRIAFIFFSFLFIIFMILYI